MTNRLLKQFKNFVSVRKFVAIHSLSLCLLHACQCRFTDQQLMDVLRILPHQVLGAAADLTDQGQLTNGRSGHTVHGGVCDRQVATGTVRPAYRTASERRGKCTGGICKCTKSKISKWFMIISAYYL